MTSLSASGVLQAMSDASPAAPAQPTVQQLFDLTGRTALVTGASGYLGTAFATALAEAGATVIPTSRQRDVAEQCAARLPTPTGQSHRGWQLDHQEADSLPDIFQSILQEFPLIDILVNNGHEGLAADWTTVTPEQFTRQLSNATGYFTLSRLLRDHAASQQRPASIILLGSMYGLVGSYPEAYEGVMAASPVAYHTLKGGLLQMARHLAVYWAKDHIRVNCISPGPFPPPRITRELVDRLIPRVPLKRMGTPTDLKGAVVFLASDASAFMTGQNLVIDGGWTAW